MTRLTVLGAGTMGHGIAHAAIAGGFDTRMYDVSDEAVGRGRGAIELATHPVAGGVVAEAPRPAGNGWGRSWFGGGPLQTLRVCRNIIFLLVSHTMLCVMPLIYQAIMMSGNSNDQ